VNRGYGGIVAQSVPLETGKRTAGMGMLEKMDALMELMGLVTPGAYRPAPKLVVLKGDAASVAKSVTGPGGNLLPHRNPLV